MQEDVLPKTYILTLAMGSSNYSFPELRILDQITGVCGTFVRIDITIKYGIGMGMCKWFDLANFRW